MKLPKPKILLIFILGMVTFAAGSFIVSTLIFVKQPTPVGIIDDYEQICFWPDVDGITAAVSPRGCYSTSCTSPKHQIGTAIVDKQEYKIQLETRFVLVETSRSPLPCTENCAGGGTIQFHLGHLIPNRYEVWYRDNKVGELNIFSGLPTPRQCFENYPTYKRSAIGSVNRRGAKAESTADWNSYTNEKYGYTFSYPADCFFGRMPLDCKEKPPEERRPECLCFLDSTNPNRIFMQAFLGDGDQLSLAEFAVSHSDSPLFNPPQSTDLVGWINKNFSSMFEDIPDETNFDLDGVPALRVNYPRSSQSPGGDDIYYLHNELLFQIQLLNVDNEDNVELYDQMLSTFRLQD